MTTARISCISLCLTLLLFTTSCSDKSTSTASVAPSPAAETTQQTEAAPAEKGPNVVELTAVGTSFKGPAEIPAGWTTFKFSNKSDMVHFAIIDVLPEGVTASEMSANVMAPFQEAMDAMVAGDEAATNAAFGKFPEWIGSMARNGGPGMLSGQHDGQATVYIAPGHYVIECYVKTNGIFHSTPAKDGAYGMILPLTVTASDAETTEPRANMTIAITNKGYQVVDGELRKGPNTIRVDYKEQQSFPSFTGNDIHLMRVAEESDRQAASDWVDWRKPHGLETPTPVEFLGGLNDLPAGKHGYFSVNLEPGDYAFIGEQPDPQATGFILPVSVADES